MRKRAVCCSFGTANNDYTLIIPKLIVNVNGFLQTFCEFLQLSHQKMPEQGDYSAVGICKRIRIVIVSGKYRGQYSSFSFRRQISGIPCLPRAGRNEIINAAAQVFYDIEIVVIAAKRPAAAALPLDVIKLADPFLRNLRNLREFFKSNPFIPD